MSAVISTHDYTDAGRRTSAMSAREALSIEPRPIEVPENGEIYLSPENRELAHCFARVRLGSYADLQLLGFVPRRLSEDKVRAAIAADDDEAYRLATTVQRAGECGCGDSGGCGASRPVGLRTAYNRVRTHHNRALARVLADEYQARIEWDSPVAAVSRRWVSVLGRIPEIIVAITSDITIKHHGTLTVGAGTKSLLARHIRIHQTGRLAQQGSYLKIWANSLTQFQFSISDALETLKVAPVWALVE